MLSLGLALCRAAEVWEELQAKMDKLPETRFKEGSFITT